MVKYTISITLFLFGAAAMGAHVEKGASGKPGLLRTERALQKAPKKKTGTKAVKAGKTKVFVCHYTDEDDDSCEAGTWKTLHIGETAREAHLANHNDFDGTCDAKCEEDGGTYNSETCLCEVDDVGCMPERMLLNFETDIGEEWGRQV